MKPNNKTKEPDICEGQSKPGQTIVTDCDDSKCDWPRDFCFSSYIQILHSEKFVMNEEVDSLLTEKVSNLLLT